MIPMSQKSQSAMEYLMTYGWAILIIAVVLGALYSLGLFNGTTITPNAQPGGCQVFRPNGAGTVAYISLAGSCTNQLPEFVAKFNGANSYIASSTGGFPVGNSQRSVFAWVYMTNTVNPNFIQEYGTFNNYNGAGFYIQGSQLYVTTLLGEAYGASLNIPLNRWVFVGYTYSAGSSNTVTAYYDGQSLSSGFATALNTVLGSGVNGQSYIGGEQGSGNPFGGYVANLQMYNTSLDANSVNALYLEGIGGPPINLQSLVGWWPLNSNANDYSGELNSGSPTNVIYTNQWINGYTVP